MDSRQPNKTQTVGNEGVRGISQANNHHPAFPNPRLEEETSLAGPRGKRLRDKNPAPQTICWVLFPAEPLPGWDCDTGVVLVADLAAEHRGKDGSECRGLQVGPEGSGGQNRQEGKDRLGVRTTAREESRGPGRKLDMAVRERAVHR